MLQPPTIINSLRFPLIIKLPTIVIELPSPASNVCREQKTHFEMNDKKNHFHS